MSYAVQPIVVGDTINLIVFWKKDGSVWDVTGATATLFVKDPDGNVEELAASIADGPAGECNYVYSSFDTPGTWVRQWRVVKSGITLLTKQIEFQVYPSLD